MDHYASKRITPLNRIGFHYFPDTDHYQEKDLSIWLPILKNVGAKTLVLESPTSRAIPEFFISAIAEEKIDIIIDFNLHGFDEVNLSDLQVLLNAYGKWGATYGLLLKDVNSRKSWKDTQWVSTSPVKESCSRWLMFSKMAQDSGIKPILPTMIPGGDFWDLAFLEQFLKSVASSPDSSLVDNMVISALAWSWERHLNWGSGGPEKWTGAKPYHSPSCSQDQKGFHIFEWYASIAAKTLGFIPPVVLFESGIASREPFENTINQSFDSVDEHLNIIRLMSGENAFASDEPEILLEPVPFYVVANNFYLLSCNDNDPAAHCSWFTPDGRPGPSAAALLDRRQKRANEAANTKQPPEVHQTGKKPFSIRRYILLSHDLYEKLPELEVSLSKYIARYKPQIGFSIQQALQAAYVLVVGENGDYSFCDLEKLKQNGSLVRTTNMNALESLEN